MKNRYLMGWIKESSLGEIEEMISGWDNIFWNPEYRIYKSGNHIIHLDYDKGIKKLYEGIHLIGSIGMRSQSR